MLRKQGLFAGGVLAALLPLGFPAFGGEKETVSPYANGTWERGQEQAAQAQLVIVGKVVEAGKPEGSAWENWKPGSNKPGYEHNSFLTDLRQNLKVELKETIRGDLKDDKLIVKIGQVGMPSAGFYRIQTRLQNWREIPVAEFALAKDTAYLFFLSAAKTGKDKDGKETVAAEHLAKAVPMAAPAERLLKSVRAFCRVLTEWEQPPKLSDEADARVKALVADLGAEDFEKRDGAKAALKVLGACARPYLEAAAKDKDPERSFRAREVLLVLEPVPGADEFPLTAEENRQVRTLVADLGAEDIGKRDRAEADLKMLGVCARLHLQAAAYDKNSARSSRARKILKALDLAPGTAELLEGAPRTDAVKPR